MENCTVSHMSSQVRGVSLGLRGPRFNTGIHPMKQFAHNWYLPCCQCTETCSHVSFIQNDIYRPGPVVNRFCPELTRCCSQCVIPLVPIPWIVHSRVVKTLATTVGGEGCLWDSEVPSSTLVSASWSNSLIIGIYPDASARRHVSFIQNNK